MWNILGSVCVFVAVAECVMIPNGKKSNGMMPWMSVHPRSDVRRVRQAIVCPGGSECPEFATCCQMGSGQWGCCPFPEATCCSDGVHCCPKNNQCDLAQQRCTASGTQESVPLGKKFPSSKTSSVRSITCPDRQSECPDTTTCCQMTSGDWGCCPFESAICCSDKLHCCPKDTVCDLEQQRCTKSQTTDLYRASIPQSKTYLYRNTTENVCPDSHPCADQTTCCKLKSGKYGCCPFPQADCCSDGLHCCPEGYKCDVKGGKCAKA